MSLNVLSQLLPDVPYKELQKLIQASEIFRILQVALQFDLFSLIKESKSLSVEEIAEKLSIKDFSSFKRLLDILVASGFLVKLNGKYSLTRLSEIYLVKDSFFHVNELFLLYSKNEDSLTRINTLLLEERKRGSGEDYTYIDEVFIVGHAQAALTGSLQKSVNILAELPEFKNAKRMLDLGGGHGLYAIAFAQLNPSLEVVVFDLPHVIPITRRYIEAYRMVNRVKVMAGDFNVDNIGEGYDIVFMSDITVTVELLKKVHKSLNKDGLAILRRWFINDDELGPLTSLLFDFKLSLIGSKHRVLKLKEYEELFVKANFQLYKVINLVTPEDPAILIIAKKGEECW